MFKISRPACPDFHNVNAAKGLRREKFFLPRLRFAADEVDVLRGAPGVKL
jgi:hypothetical protein